MSILDISILHSNIHLLKEITSWKHSVTDVGRLFYVDGFTDYNNLLNINKIFSSDPKGIPVDRTGNINLPWKYFINRYWKTPKKQITIDEVFAQRVRYFELIGEKINVFWSGGIDSTAIVNAFIANLTNKNQLRVLYSPYSESEHKDYLTFLKSNNIEAVDIKDLYLDTYFDGIFITGDTGDEMNAGPDKQFFDNYGPDVLHKSWKDFFLKKNNNSKFLDFCESYFSLCGRPLDTVLEARWWFFINSKLYNLLSDKYRMFVDYPNFNRNIVHGFFDCDEYESYMFFNLDNILIGNEYKHWKQTLKNYSFKIDKFKEWSNDYQKINSKQLYFYVNKKATLNNLNYIFVLSNGVSVKTPNLPLFSRLEYNRYVGNNYDYLWNAPDLLG